MFDRAAPRRIARIVAASLAAVAGMLTVPANPARADSLIVSGCVGVWWGTHNCVIRKGPAGDPYIRLVPSPSNEAETTRAAERDRRWMDRCHPVIAQDRYGVPRYHYGAAGCEFGVIE